MGVANADSGAGALGQLNQPIELPRYHFCGGIVIKKHVAPCIGNSVFLRHILRDTLNGGAAIDKKKIGITLQYLHQPLHVPGVSSEQAPHVVVYASHVGNRSDSRFDGLLKLLARHVERDASRPQWMVVGCLHG